MTQRELIDIAIVTTAIPPRRTARRETDDQPAETRTGSIWVRRGERIRRKTIESVTAAGIRLELQAFFERHLGRNIRVQIIEPVHADKAVTPAILSLVDASVFEAPHGYSQFKKARPKHVKPDFSPFSYGVVGREHRAFRPAWYVEPEPPILLRSLAGDAFTYPATDADENDGEAADVSEFDSRVYAPDQSQRPLYQFVKRSGTYQTGKSKKQEAGFAGRRHPRKNK